MRIKYLFISIVCFLAMSAAHAQSTPEAFLGLLPKAPVIDCSRESSQQSEANQAFQNQITSVQDALSDAIKKEKQKNKNPKLSKNVKAQAAAQSGLSEDELKAAADRKTNRAEKERLTDKSGQSQTVFSMEEMQQVKKMSKADRQKWAMENYGKVTQNERQKADETKPYQAQSASMASLAAEQQRLAQNLQQHRTRLDKMKNELETTAQQQRVIMDSKIKAIEKKYKDVNDGEGATAEDMRKLRERNKLIRDAKIEYCSKLTPLQINYLTMYESVLKENILPDLKRTEEIAFQISKTTMAQAEETCFDRLRAVEDYAAALRKAYDFYLPVNKIE